VQRTGSKESWEVEAIDPEILQNEIHEAVLTVLDVEQLNAVQQRQAVEQTQVAAIRRRLGSALRRLIAKEGI